MPNIELQLLFGHRYKKKLIRLGNSLTSEYLSVHTLKSNY